MGDQGAFASILTAWGIIRVILRGSSVSPHGIIFGIILPRPGIILSVWNHSGILMQRVPRMSMMKDAPRYLWVETWRICFMAEVASISCFARSRIPSPIMSFDFHDKMRHLCRQFWFVDIVSLCYMVRYAICVTNFGLLTLFHFLTW